MANRANDSSRDFTTSRYPDAQALARAVASRVVDAVNAGIHASRQARLIFSGGGTPEAYLPEVAKLRLAWEMVTIYLSDERAVALDSRDANAAMIRRVLFGDVEARAATFAAWPAPEDPARSMAALLQMLPASNSGYDLALLGMGPDGHFASIFPSDPALASLLSPTNEARLAMTPAPLSATPAVPRLTMTLAEIQRSRHISLVIRGEEKLALLQRAFELGDAHTYPIAALRGFEVLWCP